MMRKIVKKENVFGGNGIVLFEYLLNEEQLNGMCKLYAKIKMKPGSSLGYHVHEGESETYYILSGEASYDNNGEKMKVYAGDVTFTASGQGHSIVNDGTEDLVFMELIIYDEKQSLSEKQN